MSEQKQSAWSMYSNLTRALLCLMLAFMGLGDLTVRGFVLLVGGIAGFTVSIAIFLRRRRRQ